MAPRWKEMAQNFEQFRNAIKAELDTKDEGTEWTVQMQVRKVGNPIHEYRIVLDPA